MVLPPDKGSNLHAELSLEESAWAKRRRNGYPANHCDRMAYAWFGLGYLGGRGYGWAVPDRLGFCRSNS